MRRLLEEGPQEGDALEGLQVVRFKERISHRTATHLAQTHGVRHNAPVLVLDHHTSCAFVQELLVKLVRETREVRRRKGPTWTPST